MLTIALRICDDRNKTHNFNFNAVVFLSRKKEVVRRETDGRKVHEKVPNAPYKYTT